MKIILPISPLQREFKYGSKLLSDRQIAKIMYSATMRVFWLNHLKTILVFLISQLVTN